MTRRRKRRFWTAAELGRLRAAVTGRRAHQIDWSAVARRLRRTVYAVRQRALQHNLYLINSQCDYGPEFIAFLRAKHTAGWSDPEIAAAWGGQYCAVSRHRRRLGLSSNAYNARHRAKCAATQFKPGQIRGQAARNYKAIGTVVIRTRNESVYYYTDKSGRRRRTVYKGRRWERRRWIKIGDGGRPQDRWIPYAVHVWRQAHGPVPPGHFVVHRDGVTLNDDLGNLMLITHQERIAWQYSIRPRMEARRRAGAARASRQHWADRRAIQAAHVTERARLQALSAAGAAELARRDELDQEVAAC